MTTFSLTDCLIFVKINRVGAIDWMDKLITGPSMPQEVWHSGVGLRLQVWFCTVLSEILPGTSTVVELVVGLQSSKFLGHPGELSLLWVVLTLLCPRRFESCYTNAKG